MTRTAPTRGAAEADEDRWASKPGVAAILRALVVAIPVGASWALTRALASSYWRPAGTVGAAVWLAQLVVVGSAVVMLTGRAARRLLPLATLYSLSIVFPDQAPSRFRVALRSGNVRSMQAQFAEVRAHGFADDRSTAMAQILELIAALSRHEPRTRGHTDRVRAYTDVIGEEMGLGPDERDKLRWAAMMHDIGKLAVPAQILNKAGKPTDDEWAQLVQHPAIGGEMVEPLRDWLGEWRLAASEHHERWDGGGYPRRLAGEQISLAGRIVAVADAYDVITSARSYKKPMSSEAARRELVRCAGTQFDPAIVRAFLNASIGRRTSRLGALGWLLEVPRAFVTVATQGATSAGAVVAAGSIAAAAATMTPPPPDPAHDAAVVAARDASNPAGVGMIVSVRAPKRVAATATGTTGATGATGATGSTGSTGARSTTAKPGATGATGATVTTRPSGTSDAGTSAPTTTLAGTDTTTTVAGGGAATPQSPSTTTTVAPATTTTAPATACDALNAGATQLAGANLAGCVVNIAGRRLANVDLTGADLQGANLQGMTIDGGSLYAADLGGAILNGATLSHLDLRSTNWTGASLRATTFDTNDLSSAVLRNVVINGSQWTADDLTRADFTGATGKPSKSVSNTWSATVCANGTAGSTACF